MITKKKIIYLLCVLSLMSIGLGCVEGVEVELWGECYNIDETTTLELSNNGLTGEIPDQIGDLINLTYLNLYSNQLTGQIPSEIGNLTNLTYLDLQINQLSGQIPSEIGNLTNLYLLHLNENYLAGHIPENICDLTIDWSGIWSDYYQIPYFDIDDNNLCPPYPECIVEDIGEQNTLDCMTPGNSCILDNNEEGFYDCELCCWEISLLSWLGDDYCDYLGGCGWEGPQFNCYELGYDCGDCQDYVADPNGICTEICIQGDINDDSITNVSDIVLLINIIFSNEFNLCGDLNTDGVIDIIDVVHIVNIILNE